MWIIFWVQFFKCENMPFVQLILIRNKEKQQTLTFMKLELAMFDILFNKYLKWWIDRWQLIWWQLIRCYSSFEDVTLRSGDLELAFFTVSWNFEEINEKTDTSIFFTIPLCGKFDLGLLSYYFKDNYKMTAVNFWAILSNMVVFITE